MYSEEIMSMLCKMNTSSGHFTLILTLMTKQSLSFPAENAICLSNSLSLYK